MIFIREFMLEDSPGARPSYRAADGKMSVVADVCSSTHRAYGVTEVQCASVTHINCAVAPPPPVSHATVGCKRNIFLDVSAGQPEIPPRGSTEADSRRRSLCAWLADGCQLVQYDATLRELARDGDAGARRIAVAHLCSRGCTADPTIC
jgi:hypothetical protein